MATLTRRWTYEDYLKLEDDKRYEVLEGELVEIPAPSVIHQRIVGRLFRKMSAFVEESDLGEVFISPVDVVLSEENVLQPDVVFVSKENSHIVKDKAILGAPDLVVEVISPSSFKRDTEDKRKIYARFGVKELWFVFPGERTVEVFSLKEGSYEVCSFDYEEGEVKSYLLEGFKVNLSRELFKEVH